ncbi:MAG: AbrB/MazE/SpoVT family DNA-binding domain-containing protein [Candidatus Hodarchaeales archaeon]
MPKTSGFNARVGKRFTIVIPKEIREKLHLKEGEMVRISIIDDKIFIKPRRGDPFDKLATIAGDLVFNRESRDKAEGYVLKAVNKGKEG